MLFPAISQLDHHPHLLPSSLSSSRLRLLEWVLEGVRLPDFLRLRLFSRLNCSPGPPGLELPYDSGNAAKLTRLGVLRPLPLLDPPDPPPKKFGMLSSEGEGDGPGDPFVGDKVGDRIEGDRKEECGGGEDGLVDEECLFLVRSLETEAVAWEVLASGNVAGAKIRGGGRLLDEVEFDTALNQLETSRLPETSSHIQDREAESCLSLSRAIAWSSMNIFLNDVTAKFVCVSLSEELLAGSSIGGVSGFGGRAGEED